MVTGEQVDRSLCWDPSESSTILSERSGQRPQGRDRSQHLLGREGVGQEAGSSSQQCRQGLLTGGQGWEPAQGPLGGARDRDTMPNASRKQRDLPPGDSL